MSTLSPRLEALVEKALPCNCQHPLDPEPMHDWRGTADHGDDSMNTKELGRISHVGFGAGGYQEAMFGLSLTFSGKGWGTSTFIGAWAHDPDKHCKWTKKDQEREFVQALTTLKDTLKAAGKSDISQLIGVPVEVEFENNSIKSWRVLEEVL